MTNPNDTPSMPLPCIPVRAGELRDVLAAVATALTADTPERDLTGAFEQAVQRALACRTVRLREIPARYQARLVTPTRTADSLVIGVPSTDPRVQAVLEAAAEPGRPLRPGDDEWLTSVTHVAALVLEAGRMRAQTRAARIDGAAPLIGSSVVMQALRAQVERVAATDFTVLIQGESGTGKELVARQLHELSPRRKGPFVAVNCAAVVETLLEAELFGIEDRTATGVRGRRGKFEHADGGTLFLDEVSDLSLSAQAKLLRAIQELAIERVGGVGARRVNVRIIVATNRPLTEMVERGLFRADLFYRLGGVDIHVPPLRDRREDIVGLAQYFLARHRQTRELSLAVTAADALRLYAWPGNVRELQRMIERSVALAESPTIELDDLPAHVRGEYTEILGPSIAAEESMRAWASRYARLVLERCGRNKRRACRILNVSYHTLQSYLQYDAARTTKPPDGWAESASAPGSASRQE